MRLRTSQDKDKQTRFAVARPKTDRPPPEITPPPPEVPPEIVQGIP